MARVSVSRRTRGSLLRPGIWIVGAAAWLAFAPGFLRAAAPSSLGSASCLAVACHGRQHAPRSDDARAAALSRAGLAYRQFDPHARAAETVDSPQYQAIVDRLKPNDEQIERRCAACHDPRSLAPRAASGATAESDAATLAGTARGTVADEPRAARGAEERTQRSEFTLAPAEQGIGCEDCHGSAGGWLSKHYERGVGRETLRELGFRDLKHAFQRAQTCAGCHVGDEQRDLNHDLYAAGHPPLWYEFSAYHARLPKHWREPSGAEAERAAIALWSAGQLASGAAALELVGSRASRAARDWARADNATAWPEFAEYNCLACHQRLGGAARVAAVEGKLVRQTWGDWHFALAAPLAHQVNPEFNHPERLRELAQRLSPPRENDATLEEIAALARDWQTRLEDLGAAWPVVGGESGPVGERTGLAAAGDSDRFERVGGARGVAKLAANAAQDDADWASLCQSIGALRAVLRGGADRVRSTSSEKHWQSAEQNLRRLAAELSFGQRQTERGPVDVDWPRSGLPTVGEQLPGRIGRWESLPRNVRAISELLRAPTPLE